MAIVLGPNRYGKAETRLLRVVRDTERHTLRDLNVSTSLVGDFAAAHVVGDQAHVLPTDTQKNAVFALARRIGVGEIEEFGIALARHFVERTAPVDRGGGADRGVRLAADRHRRTSPGGHDHAFTRSGQEVRTTDVVAGTRRRARRQRAQGPGGAQVDGLGVRRVPGGRAHHPARDPRPRAGDRAHRPVDLRRRGRPRRRRLGRVVRRDPVRPPAALRRRALARAAAVPVGDGSGACSRRIRRWPRSSWSPRTSTTSRSTSSPFGLDNPGEVFHVTDRPYGLIEVTVERDGRD